MKTPLPWRYRQDVFEDWGLIRGPDHMPVASTAMSARHDRSDISNPRTASGEVEANAEFIVRAVNCHEKLLAACKEAAILYDAAALSPLAAAAKYGPGWEPPSDDDCLAVRQMLADAIAEAESP